jgi:HSP20 family molecular chaperone IbpA
VDVLNQVFKESFMSRSVRQLETMIGYGLSMARAEELVEEINHLSDEIARRACELLSRRGAGAGPDLHDWLEAESSLLIPVPVQVVESADRVRVRAEVAGFGRDQLCISVGPRRLVIAGKIDPADGLRPADYAAGGDVIETGRRSKRICRIVELPVEVQVGKEKFDVRDGVLELTVPIAFRSLRNETGIA